MTTKFKLGKIIRKLGMIFLPILKKTKRAWQEARDAASVAMFYAMGLSQLEREEGYDPYQKSAMLTIPEIRLMPTAYAKENRKLNTKEEVFSKYTKMDIVKDILIGTVSGNGYN